MEPNTAPLNRNSRGSALTKLQEGLLLLLRWQVLHVSEDKRAFFEEGLTREQIEQRYDDVTTKVVGVFLKSSLDWPSAARLMPAVIFGAEWPLD